MKYFVEDLMVRKVVHVIEDESVLKAAGLMTNKKIGGIFILNKESHVVGVVTMRDIIERMVIEEFFPSKLQVKELMSTPVVTVSPQATIEEAARKMAKEGIKRLAVVESGKLVGIITQSDIIRNYENLHEVVKVWIHDF